MYNLPKDWFIHSVIYREKNEKTLLDDWEEVEDRQTKEITVHNVRFSANNSYSRDVRGLIDNSVGEVFILPQYSTFTDFKKGNEIEFNDQVFKIERVDTYHQPTSNEVHHIRLGLI